MPLWFKPTLVVLAGMALLVLADAPRNPSLHNWRNSLADPMTLRLMGAIVMGMGVYWGILLYTSHTSRKRKRR